MNLYIDPVFNNISQRTVNYTLGFDADFYWSHENTESARPVVIVLHAGGASKNDHQPTKWARDVWAVRGYIGISASYKDNPGKFTEQEQKEAVQNIWKLLSFLVSNAEEYKIKKGKIFVMGISAGALTAIQSAVALNDKTNPYFVQEDYIQGLKVPASATLSGACSKIFQSFIDGNDQPNYFYHGLLDKTVPYSQAQETYKKMIDAGIGSTFKTFEDADHSLNHHLEIVKDLVPKFGEILGDMVKPLS